MNTESDIELPRLTAALEATEVLLARERGRLHTAVQQGETTIVVDARIEALLRRRDRLRTLRTNLLTATEARA